MEMLSWCVFIERVSFHPFFLKKHLFVDEKVEVLLELMIFYITAT